ncbi:hypothetical protein Q7C36_011052 [Tachysurus vachellii]|uniref:Uncharacterized protein n=1 Tax=Tachysurus vachellii TaxID=175792 RepID=A0AA88SS54_TACVA|nr:hypothetical protein Q7C36_011052 [Tachysurus vachellii]
MGEKAPADSSFVISIATSAHDGVSVISPANQNLRHTCAETNTRHWLLFLLVNEMSEYGNDTERANFRTRKKSVLE